MSARLAAAAGRHGAVAVALSALLLAVAVQERIEAGAARRPEAHPLLYLPSGKYLRVVALGFDGLMADIVYLWAIQYYGNYAIADRYDYLDRIFGTVITDLDPHYVDPYLIGSMIMDVEARRPQEALALLDKGIAANPDQWILAFEAGFLCYNELHDYPRAAQYYEAALRAPDVHPSVRRLYAEMINRSGDKRSSLREWAAIYDSASDDYVRTVAWKHVHDLKVEVDVADLNAAVVRFRGRHGRPPRALAELVESGEAAAIPVDPEERDYRYSPRDGVASYAGSMFLAR